jgi:hypothetical protein
MSKSNCGAEAVDDDGDKDEERSIVVATSRSEMRISIISPIGVGWRSGEIVMIGLTKV